MTKTEKISLRLQNMAKWTIDDFIFYADILNQAFVLNVEFDPEKPEIGWGLFQQKLEAANKEFEATGDVESFQMIDVIDKMIQDRRQRQDN